MIKSNTKKQAVLSLLNQNLETYFCDIPRCERPDVEIEDDDDNKIYVYTPYDGEILTFNPQDSIKNIVKSLTCQIIKIKLTEDRNYELPYGVSVSLADYEKGGFFGATIHFPDPFIYFYCADEDEDYLTLEGKVSDVIKKHQEDVKNMK